MILATSFLQSVGDFFYAIGRFLANVVSSIFQAITFLVESSQTITFILGYMPAVIGGAALAFISLWIVRFLLLK